MAAPAYRPDVDGLRALAILPVVLYHAFPDVVPGGFVGVDLFFVVSGYLISRILLAGFADGSFRFADFYARRIRRIVPAMLLVLLATAASGALLLAPEERRQLGLHVMAGATFTSNLLLWREAGYFDGAAETKPLLHLWSLGVEEQFYLVWPAILLLAWRRRCVLPVVCAAAGISFIANLHGVVADPEGAFYSPVSRFWELMVGCALAATEFGLPSAAPRTRENLAAICGFLLVAAGIVLIDRTSAFPGIWALLPILGAALLVGAGSSWLNAKFLSCGPMVGLGQASYALYLWHWPLLAFLNVRYPESPPVEARGASLLLAALLAWITDAFLERRIRTAPARRTVPVLAGGCALLFLAAAATYGTEPGTGGVVDDKLRVAQDWPTAYVEDRRCKARHPASGYCAIADPDAPPTHALIGDSHGNHFYPGLAAEIARGGGNLLHLGAAGCIPFSGLESTGRANCTAVVDAALADVVSEKGIRTVILAANWHPYARGTRFSIHRNRHASPLVLESERYGTVRGNEALFVAGLARTVDLLTAAGKAVVILKQVPELEARFDTCLAQLRAALGWNESLCAVARPRVDRYAAEYAGLVDAALAGRAQVTVLDPVGVLCDRLRCRAVIDGELMYRDDVHLGVEGSRYVTAQLWRQTAPGARHREAEQRP